MASKQIGVLVGSARKESFNRKIAEQLIPMLPGGLTAAILSIDGLPLFNQDYDDGGATPQPWQAFRQEVARMDAFLFVTPEYNRSIPLLLKNALDIASRPYGENKWAQKPGGVISVSPGGLGGFGANHHLRQCLAFLDVYTMQQPEAYLSHCADAFDDSGALVPKTRAFLQSYVDAFAAWVDNF